jgi:magnesium-transporting ATPase (P-type)
MELDELKKSWSEYDQKLTDNLRLNEELLRKMNLNSSKKEMQKIVIYEYIGIAMAIVLIIVLMAFTWAYWNNLKYSIPSTLSTLMTFLYLSFGYTRLKAIQNIDYYEAPILEVQKGILEVKQKALKQRKFELILLPTFLLPLIPVLFKMVHDINIYQEMRLLIIEVVLIIGLSYPLLFWIYRQLYDKKFKLADQHLQELKKFENE